MVEIIVNWMKFLSNIPDFDLIKNSVSIQNRRKPPCIQHHRAFQNQLRNMRPHNQTFCQIYGTLGEAINGEESLGISEPTPGDQSLLVDYQFRKTYGIKD